MAVPGPVLFDRSNPFWSSTLPVCRPLWWCGFRPSSSRLARPFLTPAFRRVAFRFFLCYFFFSRWSFFAPAWRPVLLVLFRRSGLFSCIVDFLFRTMFRMLRASAGRLPAAGRPRSPALHVVVSLPWAVHRCVWLAGWLSAGGCFQRGGRFSAFPAVC